MYTMEYFAASSKPETGIRKTFRFTTWMKHARTMMANAITMIHFSSVCRYCSVFFIVHSSHYVLKKRREIPVGVAPV